MRTVIIGNSAAAVGCIEGLRALDPEREIVVLSREKGARVRAAADLSS